MLRVTFYSYKGGVGRTLALLNVAALLAEHNRRVLVVDLDLEAPGLGLSPLTKPPGSTLPQACPGVSDFVLDRQSSIHTEIGAYLYPVIHERFDDRFIVMTAGTRAGELTRQIEEIYRDPQGDRAYLFLLLLAEIEKFIAPDYVFFDSRTGLADVAGVCTMEVPEVVVAVCGLNEQNISGMENALGQMREYWKEASIEVATFLVLSPVPSEADLERNSGQSMEPLPKIFANFRDRPVELMDTVKLHPLGRRKYEAQARLFAPMLQDFARFQQRFPRLERGHLYHELEYDPRVPLADELLTHLPARLAQQYRRLAQSIVRATPGDMLDLSTEIDPPPMFIGGR